MRTLGTTLFGFFCVTLAARANPVLTCTVYDPAGLSAIGACSDFGGVFSQWMDFGSTFTYWGYSYAYGMGGLGITTDTAVMLFNNIQPTDEPPNPPPYESQPGPQYLAQLAISNHLTATSYYMFRGGTGLAQ